MTMSQGQKMVWAAEFVRALNEMEQFRPRIEVGEKYDDFEKRVDEWHEGVVHSAAEGAAGRAALLKGLGQSLMEGFGHGSGVAEMATEMEQDP